MVALTRSCSKNNCETLVCSQHEHEASRQDTTTSPLTCPVWRRLPDIEDKVPFSLAVAFSNTCKWMWAARPVLCERRGR
jgi:hypothetical protein